MGRDGSISWALHTPNYTPCDYFSREYLKYNEFLEPLRIISEVQTKITQEFPSNNEEASKKVYYNMGIVYVLYWKKGVVIWTIFSTEKTSSHATDMLHWAPETIQII